MRISAYPFANGFGAEIVGYDFDATPSAAAVAWLRERLLAHHLLLFRGRSLDPARQIALTRLFGTALQTCSPRLRFLPDFPEIFRVSNREGEGHRNIGCYWHSDGAYLADPTAVTLHHIIVPAADGDTLYTDLAAAYDRLTPVERARAAGLRTRSQTGVVHPLVLPHPVTGRLGLYVNLDAGAAIVDENSREDREAEAWLRRHLDQEGSFYRHHWRAGDLIAVDNFAAAHCATGSDPTALRVLHRTSIHGPAVWWRMKAPGYNVSSAVIEAH